MDQQEDDIATLTFDDEFEELPDDSPVLDDSPSARVVLQSLTPEFATIELTESKTVLGRQAAKCSPNGHVNSAILSGEHCKLTTRSLIDKAAPIWITDLSRNGVWINGIRIPFQEAKKIFDKDVITFVPTNKSVKGVNHPSYMLVDKRASSDPRPQQASITKRVMEVQHLEDDTQGDASMIGDYDHISKKTKFNSSESETATDKASEVTTNDHDEQIESELECGICHEIMLHPLILQPCLHSFCKACCKMWLNSHRDCPSCRKAVGRTGRDFKLKNIIDAFLKKHPQLARDLEEDDGIDSDTSNLIRRHPRFNDNDEDEEEDEEAEDEDEDDDGIDANGFPFWVQHRPTVCPCCDPDNAFGYVCLDNVRLAPLPQPITYVAYLQRRAIQPGHTQCQGCLDLLPLITDPTKQDIADKFRCKMCHVPSCGCTTESVEDHIRSDRSILGFLNAAEDRILGYYIIAQGLSHENVWQQIKTGMDNGTFYYLGPPPTVTTGARPGRNSGRTSASTVATATSVASSTSDNSNLPESSLGSTDATTQNTLSSLSSFSAPTTTGQNATAVAGPSTAPSSSTSVNSNAGSASTVGSTLTAPPAATQPASGQPPQPLTAHDRGRAVTSSDKLCHQCQVDFFRHGPVYQWRKSIDPTHLPPRVVSRADCWYGRGCRTQYNLMNPGHAERLNHICEPSV